MVACVDVATAEVATANVAEVAPAGMVTDAGTVAAAELEVSRTTAPPVGAGPLRVAVPCAPVPPMTELGETVTPVGGAGSTVSVAVLVVPQ
jgi:hypothetical protein